MTKKHAFGMSKKDQIKVDPTKAAANTITVFADFAAASTIKYSYLSSSSHIWDQPTSVNVPKDNTITITAYCLRRRPSKTYAGASSNGDDDLTITLVYDDGGQQVTDECTFDGLDYEH